MRVPRRRSARPRGNSVSDTYPLSARPWGLDSLPSTGPLGHSGHRQDGGSGVLAVLFLFSAFTEQDGDVEEPEHTEDDAGHTHSHPPTLGFGEALAQEEQDDERDGPGDGADRGGHAVVALVNIRVGAARFAHGSRLSAWGHGKEPEGKNGAVLEAENLR